MDETRKERNPSLSADEAIRKLQEMGYDIDTSKVKIETASELEKAVDTEVAKKLAFAFDM